MSLWFQNYGNNKLSRCKMNPDCILASLIDFTSNIPVWHPSTRAPFFLENGDDGGGDRSRSFLSVFLSLAGFVCLFVCLFLFCFRVIFGVCVHVIFVVCLFVWYFETYLSTHSIITLYITTGDTSTLCYAILSALCYIIRERSVRAHNAYTI